MRVVVTGADGQLGNELCRRLGENALPLYKRDLDITAEGTVRRVLEDLRPDAVINTAAYTDVDRAEKDSQRCIAVNVDGTRHLAEACRSVAARLVQISTDYVFSGPADRCKPFREEDTTHPEAVYARSKRDAETEAMQCPQHLIVRTCGLYVNRKERNVRNFVKTMLRLAQERAVVRVVDDQHCTPSYVPHVSRAILFLLRTQQNGVYHVVNSGATTWCRFAAELFRQADVSTRVEPVKATEYPTDAPRPAFSVLDNAKYAKLDGPALPPWQQGITEYLGMQGRRSI